jgi:hypothetical protein
LPVGIFGAGEELYKAPIAPLHEVKSLIEAGLLQPGEGVITFKYKRETTTADLLDDGSIACEVRNMKPKHLYLPFFISHR